MQTSDRDLQVQTAEFRRSAPMRFARRGYVLQRPLRWLAGGGTLAAAAGIFLSQTLFAPSHQLHYSGGVSSAHCFTVEARESCVILYDFTLGNTGKHAQERIRLEWPMDMRRWHADTQVADIIASPQPTPQPQVQSDFGPDKTVYTIAGLMPNTLIQLRMSCHACTPAQLLALRAARPAIEARGTVSEGDPRVSALWNGFTNLLRVLGLFG